MSVKVLFTSGEYSDYGVVGLYDVPSKEWVAERMREWRKMHPRKRFDTSDFMRLVEAAGAVEAAYDEAHLGDYGEFPKEVFGIGLMDKRPPSPEGGT